MIKVSMFLNEQVPMEKRFSFILELLSVYPNTKGDHYFEVEKLKKIKKRLDNIG